MDEIDGAISNDFVNKLSLDTYDDNQQGSPKKFDSTQNKENGLHTSDDEKTDTIDSVKFLSKLTSRFKKREPLNYEHLKPDFIPTLPISRKDPNYNMNHKHRGKCVIINNTHFDSPTLEERKGTQVDRDELTRCFRQLDFDVANWDEMKALQIRITIDKLAREDFSDHDCLVICVLTHGELNHLHAKDDKYYVEYLFDSFRSDRCKTLAGKPKIFIIQACRGDRLDKGTILSFDVEDSPSCSVRIPQWADFLMAYSTVPGYSSWRNYTNGSWFIQAFVTALEEHYKEYDLLSIFTITNQKVAYDFESNTPQHPDFHRRKQIPFIASMLTRRVYFNKPKREKLPPENSILI